MIHSCIGGAASDGPEVGNRLGEPDTEAGTCTVGAAVTAAADVDAAPLLPALGGLVAKAVGPSVGAVVTEGCAVVETLAGGTVGALVNVREGAAEAGVLEGDRDDESCGNRVMVASNPAFCWEPSEVKFTSIPTRVSMLTS